MSEVRVRTRVRPKNGRKTILVANAKGGSGKSTIATNIAAAYARLGFDVALVDADPQRSSILWAEQRPEGSPPIKIIDGCADPGRPMLDWVLRVPPDISRIVVDSPGGLRDDKLFSLMSKTDEILVPTMPSAIDLRAARDYLRHMRSWPGFDTSGKRLTLVGSRMDKRNKFYHQLTRLIKELGADKILSIPESYLFLRCADEGLGVADLSNSARYEEVKQALLAIITYLESSRV